MYVHLRQTQLIHNIKCYKSTLRGYMFRPFCGHLQANLDRSSTLNERIIWDVFICLYTTLQHGVEKKTVGRTSDRRRGRRQKQLLGDLQEKRGYWKLKLEALHGTVWITPLGRSYGTDARVTTEWMWEWTNEYEGWNFYSGNYLFTTDTK